MKTRTLIAILICLSPPVFSQGEMELSCLKNIRASTADIDFPKFVGHTTVVDDTIKFDKSVLVVRYTDPKIKAIFEAGLLYPALIFGASTSGGKFKFRSALSADTLTISSVTQLQISKQKKGARYFSFLIYYKGMANPSEYIFELRNNKAGRNTSMKAFIENAKLTAFGFCSILV